MSVKNVKAFFEKIEWDTALKEKWKVLDKKARDNEKEAIAELVKFASAAGFEFTPQDLAKVKAQEQKFSEDDLKTMTDIAYPECTSLLYPKCTGYSW